MTRCRAALAVLLLASTSRGTVAQSSSILIEKFTPQPEVLQHPAVKVFLSHCGSSAQDQMRVIKTKLCEMIPHLRVFLDVCARMA